MNKSIFFSHNFFYLQAYKKFECTITIPAVWTMRSNYEKFGNGYVNTQNFKIFFELGKLIFFFCLIVICRQIQDPASQRLTWYKPPLAVLVIKKVRDHMVLPPFVQLVEWLIQVIIIRTVFIKQKQKPKINKSTRLFAVNT